MDIKKIVIGLLSTTMMLALSTAHAWTIDMNFNDGPLGQEVQDSGNSYPVFTDAAGHTVYSDCAGNTQDGQCAKMSINKGSDGWGTWGGRIDFNDVGLGNPVPGTEVWISVKMFMPNDFDYSASPHLKFLRLHTTSPSKQNEGYNDFYITPDGWTHWDDIAWDNTNKPFFFIKEQQFIKHYFGDYNTDKPRLGVWETYEMYLKMDYLSVKDGGTSKVRIWKNGKLLADLDDIQTLKSAESYADKFLIFTYWNGGSPKDQHLFVDDLILTTDTPSRRDIYGNPMIGDVLSIPKPPAALQIN